MKNFNKVIFFFIAMYPVFSVEINLDDGNMENRFYIKFGEEVIISSKIYKTIRFITPKRGHYSNISADNRIEIQSIKYEFFDVEIKNCILDLTTISELSLGTYQIAWGNQPDEYCSFDPLFLNENIIQIVIRQDDTFLGYLMEHINNPFIYTPLRNLNGSNQVENNVGCDCVSFITYGLRRLGYDIPYTNPQSIGGYISTEEKTFYYPEYSDNDVYIYKNQNNEPYQIMDHAISKGIIISFREQISALYEDRGIPGVLDSEDLLIQSWFDGPLIVSMKENGFWGYPVKVYELSDL
jgi:hypothetical protein